jgi:hypothetical protein
MVLIQFSAQLHLTAAAVAVFLTAQRRTAAQAAVVQTFSAVELVQLAAIMVVLEVKQRAVFQLAAVAVAQAQSEHQQSLCPQQVVLVVLVRLRPIQVHQLLMRAAVAAVLIAVSLEQAVLVVQELVVQDQISATAQMQALLIAALVAAVQESELLVQAETVAAE